MAINELISEPYAQAFVIAISVGGFVIYIFPTITAYERHHDHRRAILVLNVLLGWTLVGWIIAFVWVFKRREHDKPSSDTFGIHQAFKTTSLFNWLLIVIVAMVLALLVSFFEFT